MFWFLGLPESWLNWKSPCGSLRVQIALSVNSSHVTFADIPTKLPFFTKIKFGRIAKWRNFATKRHTSSVHTQVYRQMIRWRCFLCPGRCACYDKQMYAGCSNLSPIAQRSCWFTGYSSKSRCQIISHFLSFIAFYSCGFKLWTTGLWLSSHTTQTSDSKCKRLFLATRISWTSLCGVLNLL